MTLIARGLVAQRRGTQHGAARTGVFPTYELGDLSLNSRPLTDNFDQAVVSGSVDLSITEASTLTLSVFDAERALLAAGVLEVASDLTVGGRHRFRLVQVAKSGDTFQLTFEDRDVARLRLVTTPRKASRGKVTRAEFAKSLVDETPGIRFWCPDLHREQPFTRADAQDAEKAPATERREAGSSSARAAGFAPGAKLTAKNVAADPFQRRIITGVLQAAFALGASRRVMIATLMCIIQESLAGKAMQQTGNDDVGIFQQGRNWISVAGAKQPGPATKAFLITGPSSWKKVHGSIKKAPGDLNAAIVKVQISVGGYAPWEAEATRMVDAFTGDDAGALEQGGEDPVTGGATYNKRYEFTRGTTEGKEDTWTALGRLAEEVRRRRFLTDREVVFAFDRDLIKQRPRMTLSETTRGVDWIDFEWDTGKKVETCTVTCRADLWVARPGDVAVIEDSGPGDGRWLTARVSGDLFGLSRSIELVRATQPKGEPRSETVTRPESDATAGGRVDAGGRFVSDGSGDGTGDGSWKYGPGVPRTLNARMRSFMDRMATFYDGTIVVTTSTNHSRFVAGTNRVSQHMGGGAADLGSNANWGGGNDAPGGFKLAIAAYRACGLSDSAARAKANVPSYEGVKCPEGSVQILWRVSGHHDHVHIGTG